MSRLTSLSTLLLSIASLAVQAEPRVEAVLADAHPYDSTPTFWSINSAEVVTSKQKTLLAGGGCNVVMYFASATLRSAAGESANWAGSAQDDRSEPHWYEWSGQAPWCVEGAGAGGVWNDTSMPFDNAFNAEGADSAYLVVGDLDDGGLPESLAWTQFGSCVMVYSDETTKRSVHPNFEEKLLDFWCNFDGPNKYVVPHPGRAAKGDDLWSREAYLALAYQP